MSCWKTEKTAGSSRVPSLAGVVTQGRTRDEALANAREAIELTIEDLRARGETVPLHGELDRGTLAAVLSEAGLSADELRQLL